MNMMVNAANIITDGTLQNSAILASITVDSQRVNNHKRLTRGDRMTTLIDREIVEIATPGPWKKPFKHSGSVYDEKEENCIVGGYYADIAEEDAKFIAHFNPAKVLDMLNQIERLMCCGNCAHYRDLRPGEMAYRCNIDPVIIASTAPDYVCNEWQNREM